MSLLKAINLDTKALVVINEYLRIRRDFPTLATFIEALATDRNEISQILQTVALNFQTLGYQSADSGTLIQGLRQALAARLHAQGQRPATPPPLGVIPPPPRRSAPTPIGQPVTPAAPRDPNSPLMQAQAKGRHGKLTFEPDPARATPARATPAPPPLRRRTPAPTTPPGRQASSAMGTQQFGASLAGLRPENIKPAQDTTRPTVLIAEDDSRARMVYRLKLEEAGYNVVDAVDGNDAWQQIKSGAVSAVVLDVKMPGISGLEIIQRMQSSRNYLPVVVVTSFSDMRDEFAIQVYPKLRYLVKPVAPEKIVQALHELEVVPT